ncbi:hypothetical protein R5R35_007256 [Gryllus longicercus]|uniref:C-type lectin domain-containing protein n=1 Tax=Gryllus longicercus TaxID=2509291 RepID=A0AAN9VT57_9ORTH
MSRSFLPMALLLLAASTPLATQRKCAAMEELALAVVSSANSTGHRRLSARLEQPLRRQEWKLDVRVGASACGGGSGGQSGGGCDIPRQWLVLTLDGPSSGHLLDSSPAPAPAPAPAPPGYLTLPGLGHYRAHPTALTRDDASALCRKEGGALVVPTSRHEVDLIFRHFFPFNSTDTAEYDRMWHGATDLVQEGKFVTDDGVPLEDVGYAVFNSGQPNGGTGENCVTIFKDKTLWDTGCNFKLSAICKVSL